MNRPGRSRIRYRCRAGRRAGTHDWFTLRQGAKRIKCTKCGSDDVVKREDQYMRAQAKRRHLYCYCAGVPFPHRLGTHTLCHKYAHDWPLPPAQEAELQAYSESDKVWGNKRRTATR